MGVNIEEIVGPPEETPKTTTTTTRTSTAPTGPSESQLRALEQLRASYRQIVRSWGMRPSKNILNLIERGIRNMWSSTQFVDRLRHTPEYRKQFRGVMWKTGMTEGQYLSQYAQYKARAQDVGIKLGKEDFAKILKRGVEFDEFSDRVDAIASIEQYGPFWNQFQFELEAAGAKVPGKKLTKKELADFVMGLGSPAWERPWQRTYVTVQLEKVAGIDVIEKRKGETAVPDSYSITRGAMLDILKRVEGVNPGFDVESLKGVDFAQLGTQLREFDLRYMRRYGLRVEDILNMNLGGPNAAKIAETAKRVKATQEAFFEPRAQEQALPAIQPAEELPQSL